jgi:long-chain acyl-CoA synthetase
VPDKVALRHLGAALTYRELGRAVGALARRLAAKVAPGEVVVILLPNSIEFHVAYFAALKVLATPALLNPLYPVTELAPLMRDAAPRAIICGPPTHEMMTGLARNLGGPNVLCLGQDITIQDLVAEPEASVGLRTATPADPAVLLFSGGTTGLPKAIEHTHKNLAFAVREAEYMWQLGTDREVFLPIVPFSHMYGFETGVLLPVSVRGETVIPERFQPEHIVELLSRHHVTVFGGGPPAIYAGVLAVKNLGSADLSTLRVCPAAGAPLPVALMERWREATGLEIYEFYGMSEIALISGTTALSGVRPGSVGKPVRDTEVQAVDLDTGLHVLPPRERGELRARGPHMMTGYRNRPEETARTIRDGFIYTGDIGYLDEDGFVFITDRKKDVVFVKGFNVFPREVEEVIYAHPKVSLAAVVGAPDERSMGERLVAFVAPRAGEKVDEGEISAHCASQLVNYKWPSKVRVVERLPLTGAGKPDRIALRRVARGEQSLPSTLDDRVPAGSAQSK